MNTALCEAAPVLHPVDLGAHSIGILAMAVLGDRRAGKVVAGAKL